GNTKQANLHVTPGPRRLDHILPEAFPESPLHVIAIVQIHRQQLGTQASNSSGPYKAPPFEVLTSGALARKQHHQGPGALPDPFTVKERGDGYLDGRGQEGRGHHGLEGKEQPRQLVPQPLLTLVRWSHRTPLAHRS